MSNTTKTTTRVPPTDCESMGLTPGVAYDRRFLIWAGWRNEGGLIVSPAGYAESDFWCDDGRYLGPDESGVSPVYAYADPA